MDETIKAIDCEIFGRIVYLVSEGYKGITFTSIVGIYYLTKLLKFNLKIRYK